MPKKESRHLFQTIPNILGQAEHFSNWLARHHEETKLECHIKKMLPPLLAANARICGYDGEGVKIVVPTSANAAILKQMTPTLIATLNATGFECKSISVDVQPRRAILMPSVTRPSLPPPPRARLKKLAASLPEGKLKKAVISLMKYGV